MFKAAKEEDATRLINAESKAGGGANGSPTVLVRLVIKAKVDD